MKKLLSVLAISSSALAFSTAASAEGECKVSITEMDWGSSIIVTAVASFVMENGYDCEVEKVPAATVSATQSLIETGKPDIVTELWMNGATGVYDLIEEGKVDKMAPVLAEGGIEGWYVPTYLVEEHPELATIDGILANPDLVGGIFNTCPEGWGCQIANASYAKAWDFEGHGIKVFDHGSGETLTASIKEAYDAKKPWFGYYWAPTDILGMYDMTKVDVGVPYDAEIHECAENKDCKEVGKSAFPPSDVYTVVTKTLKEEHPDLYDFFGKMSFPTDIMNGLLAWQAENNATPEETAAHFLVENKDLWLSWVNDDAKAKLEEVVK